MQRKMGVSGIEIAISAFGLCMYGKIENSRPPQKISQFKIICLGTFAC
jgi:hypothetical protein